MTWHIANVRSGLGRFAKHWGRTVLMAPEAARFGNNLYFWLAAWRTRTYRRPLLLTRTRSMSENLEWFPDALGYTLDRSEIGRLDTRMSVPKHHFQRFNSDFSVLDLEGFVCDVICASVPFQRALERAKLENVERTAVLHIRRGDYYSDARYRPRYAMDLDRFLVEAISMAQETWGIGDIKIVSDDATWCRENSRAIERLGVQLQFPRLEGSTLEDFAILCAADHLILSNSSFSQWGAHVNVALRGDPSRVIAPTFGVRGMNSGRAWQLNPGWRLIENARYENNRIVV